MYGIKSRWCVQILGQNEMTGNSLLNLLYFQPFNSYLLTLWYWVNFVESPQFGKDRQKPNTVRALRGERGRRVGKVMKRLTSKLSIETWVGILQWTLWGWGGGCGRAGVGWEEGPLGTVCFSVHSSVSRIASGSPCRTRKIRETGQAEEERLDLSLRWGPCEHF